MVKQLSFLLLLTLFTASILLGQKPRARDLGIPFVGKTGPLNAITDVKGVEVGHATIIEGTGKNIAGKGPIRTGVTAIFPRGKKFNPVYANWYSFCLLYTSPSPRDQRGSRMPSSA